MLTYRTGAATTPSAASFMADHLLELTVPPQQAALARYYSGAVSSETEAIGAAEVGHNLNPRLFDTLGFSPDQAVGRHAIARLLSGLRADGQSIAGKQIQSGTQSLADILSLPDTSLPDRETLENIANSLNDHNTPGSAEKRHASKRLFRLYNVPDRHPIDAPLCSQLAQGTDFNGTPVDRRHFLNAVTASKSRIGYIDLTWSADKSVSIAWAFARTDAERAMILQAHRDAVDDVMKQVEVEIGRARKGKAGQLGFERGAIGWMRFDHFTARPTIDLPDVDTISGESFTRRLTIQTNGDPQLHTHVIVPNVVVTDSGRVGGLDLKRLSGRVKELGGLYQAFLARNLRAVGVEVALDCDTGAARLTAVPDEIRQTFSKRTMDGTTAARVYAKKQGIDWNALSPSRRISLLKQGVQGDPRQARQDDLSDFVSWKHQAVALDWHAPPFVHVKRQTPQQDDQKRLNAAFDIACKLLTARFEKSAVLQESDARICAARALIQCGIASASDIDALMSLFSQRQIPLHGTETQIIWVPGPDGLDDTRMRLTTQLHVDRESELIAFARQAASDQSGQLSPKAISAGIVKSRLDFSGPHGQSQHQAMTALGTGGRLSVLIGVAGSGKTTLLAPLVHAWRDSGMTVWGTAVAWRQAEALSDAGIEASHLRATFPLLKQIEAGQVVLNRESVVVLDELSLLSTEQLLHLLRAQTHFGFRLVLIGDPLQCGAVEAGPVMDLLERALGRETISELLTSVRQKSARERTTALMFRDGQTHEALQRKYDDDTLILAPGSCQEVVEKVADLWLSRYESGRAQDGFSLTVSAPTNADARSIAVAIRERRRRIGELGSDIVRIDAVDQHGTAYPMLLAAGDRVRLYARTNARRDDGKRGIIGNNGSVLTVIGADKKGLWLRNTQGHDGFVAWATLKDPDKDRIRLGYGDVLSIDATQGVTSTEHIEAMPQGSCAVDAHRAYVQGSRHRQTTWLVTSEGAERREIYKRRPLGDIRPIRTSDLLENMARNMMRRDQRLSALALLEQARGAQRRTLQDFQKARLSLERRQDITGEPSSLISLRNRHRQNQLAQGALERVSQSSEKRSPPVAKASTAKLGAPTTDLALLMSQAIRHVFSTVGRHVRNLLQHRRLDKVAREVRSKLTADQIRLWRRNERPLTPAEIPSWGSEDYFTGEAREELLRYGHIDMARAAAFHNRTMQRQQDARRKDPCGVRAATQHVDWLFRVAGSQRNSAHVTTAETLEILLPFHTSPGSKDVLDNLLRDLTEMDIRNDRGPADKRRRLLLTRQSLVSGLAAFNLDTTTSVCWRLLLAKSITTSMASGSSKEMTREPGSRQKSKRSFRQGNNFEWD